ncbi:nitric oxide reductase activation protein NorD [Nocardia jiangxiensis]|uniref:nitric oxide reductase activation protein NorD n=1 Tax=Nocardia jiangxiensis TaxID=282685 RepID=UPI001FE139E6|nr:nitric oxide reductase activation protein [Nocardia jiangxiensis]
MSAGEIDGGPARFGLLASGIAGRALRVAPAAPDESPWTDGRVVFVDAEAPALDQIVELTVQASMIGAGSFESELLRRLARRSPAVLDRYLMLEGHRALAANGDLLPVAASALVDQNIAELSGCAATSLVIASGKRALGDPPPEFGTIHPKRLLTTQEKFAEQGAPDTRPPDSADAEDDSPDELDDDDSGGKLPALFSNVVGGQGLPARLFRRMLSLGRESEGGITAGGVPRSARALVKPGRIDTGGTGTAAAADAVAELRREGLSYPEWDVHRRRYRPGWCTVAESDPRAGDHAIPIAPVSNALMRALARLRSSLDHKHRRMQGDDIDVDAVVDERVQLLSGASTDGAVYIESVRCTPDLAVVVLLDISGSAALPSVSGGTVHDQQRTAALMLTSALHALGNRVALYGFYSQGRAAVRALRVKRFDDRLDAAALRRLAALEPAAYTRMGAAVRYGTTIASEYRCAARTLLVVLSDGFAYDHGYEGVYAEADARRALSEARRQGIGCVCLSVGAETGIDALRRVFGTAAYAAVASPQEVSQVAAPLFRDALRSADLRRRMMRARAS